MEHKDYYAGIEIPELGDKALDIAVIGSGSFGTAMANLIVHNGHNVTLYGRRAEAIEAMRATRVNERYLPGALLSDRITYTSSLSEAVSGKSIVVFAVPAQTFRQVSSDAAPYLEEGVIAVNLAKGIEKKTLKRMSEVAAETIPSARYVALSGPTHAEEIVMNAPAGIVAASADSDAAKTVQDAFMSEQLRIYTQDDMTGVEIAGAVKNVIAIATGISDGMHLGNNARAALMTRSMHEIKRLGKALGANAETFSGLSGIGDLIVTCSTDLSRNRRCGLLIGQGLKAEEAVEKVGSVVEGYYTAEAVNDLAAKLGVEMPVCKATRAVLKGELEPGKALRMLMSRNKKDELQ
jgi:glycerol-3-phosphate dehydrogenase